MTIRLLTAYDKYPINAIVTLDAGTEAGLVAAKMATTTTTGGVPYVAPVVPNQRYGAQVELDASGVVVGLTHPNGSRFQVYSGAAPNNGDGRADGTVYIQNGIGTGTAGIFVKVAGVYKPVSGAGASAVITGTYTVGQTLTATYPAGVVGTLQFTRTMLAAPFTKSLISGAVANAVNSLTYAIQSGVDEGFVIGVDCSNQVLTVTGGAVPAAAATVSTVFRSIYTQDLGDNTTYNGRVAVRDSLRTGIILRNKTAYPLQYSFSSAANSVRNNPYNYTKLLPGQEVYATGIDQWWVQPFIYTTESITSSGTTATVKLTGHGFTTGQTISMFSATPGDYRWGGVITVIDADTFTYQTTNSNIAAATVQGQFVLEYLTVEVELIGTL